MEVITLRLFNFKSKETRVNKVFFFVIAVGSEKDIRLFLPMTSSCRHHLGKSPEPSPYSYFREVNMAETCERFK